MNQAFEAAQAKAKVPGSAVLNAWRDEYGPERLREVKNAVGDRSNLTIQELSDFYGGGSHVAAPVVSQATAMRVSAVYACVALIAGAISTMPMHVYERTPDGGRKRVDHPYWWLLNEQPYADFSAAVFWEYLVSARLFSGDGFAEILRPSYRSASSNGFLLHHPMRVQPFRDSGGDLWYRITPQTGNQYIVSPADMIHIPSLGYDGCTSPSPITYGAKQAVGTSMAAAQWSQNFFVNGARPDFALATDKNLSLEQADVLRRTWLDRHGGVTNAHLPAILTGGLKVEQLTMSAVDSQILATSGWNLEEICRVLGVPPFMVGSTEKSTSWGTGQENMGRGFVKYTLLRDLRKIEQEFNRKLWPIRQKYFVEFDVSGIERGDLKTENEAYRVALGRAGEDAWVSVNEVRRAKLLPPVDGGDELKRATASPPGAATAQEPPL